MADFISEASEKFLEKFWTTVSGFFQRQFELVWTGFLGIIPDGVERGFKAWVDTMHFSEDEQWRSMLDSFQASGMIDADTWKDLYALRTKGFPLDWISYLVVFYGLNKTYIDNFLYNVTADVRHNLAAKYSPELPNPAEVIGAAFVAPEKTGEIRLLLRKFGFSDESIDLMFLSRYKMYDETTIRILFLRGEISTDQMFMRMRELGYTDTRIKEIIKTWEIIPSPQDLLYMVGKEAFEPDIIQKIGLDDEFPQEQVRWLEMQGVSEEWAHKYWFAHWDQPSVMQGFEMLHRGVIDKSELDVLFKAVEIPPFWREKLTQIAYMPYTRVDTRRMHELGVLDTQGIFQAYLDQGYDEEKAEKMTEFTVRYNQQNDKDLTRGQILDAYQERLINRNETIEWLTDLDYSQDQAEYLVAFEDFKYTRDLQRDLIGAVKDRYVNILIERREAQTQLAGLDLPSEQIDVLIEKWTVKRQLGMKIPSKTDLDKFLRNGIINDDAYRYEMRKLGYGAIYINWYHNLVKMKKAG